MAAQNKRKMDIAVCRSEIMIDWQSEAESGVNRERNREPSSSLPSLFHDAFHNVPEA